MPFNRPTLTELNDRISSDFQSRITGASTLLRRSVLKVFARVLAGAFHLMYGFLEFISKQLFASSSDQDYLDRIASEYGIVRVAATKASGTGTVTGTDGTVIPSGSTLQNSDGVEYVTTADATIASSTATLSFEASDAGADGNDDPAVVLTFINPIIGVSSNCTVGSSGITGGADIESDEALRERVLVRKRQPPHGGSENDYVSWAKEVPGVTRAWCFPSYSGVGTVAVAFVRDDEDPITPNAAERLTVEEYIIEHVDPGTGFTVGIPVTAEPGFSVIALSANAVSFNIDIYPNTAAVQAVVEDELEALLQANGGPGETVYLSQIQQAISNALGEGYHRLNSPIIDVTCPQTQVLVMGTVTFGAY